MSQIFSNSENLEIQFLTPNDLQCVLFRSMITLISSSSSSKNKFFQLWSRDISIFRFSQKWFFWCCFEEHAYLAGIHLDTRTLLFLFVCYTVMHVATRKVKIIIFLQKSAQHKLWSCKKIVDQLSAVQCKNLFFVIRQIRTGWNSK